MTDGRVLDLHLHLLDRQVIDVDGRMVCKVDDLELELDTAGRPYVTAILVGPRALGPRLGGRLAGADRQQQPPRIDFAQVTDIGSAVKLARRADEVDVGPLERWVDEHVIGRIPGSTHEGE